MHDRKRTMFEHSDGFIALPGGLGTLEELAEIATWAQIGIHAKPVGVLNVDGFYDSLLGWLDRCVEDQLLKPANRDLLIDRDRASDLLDALRTASPSTEPKWLDLDQA